MNFKIEKKIPLPPMRGKYYDLVSQMTCGDSVLVDTASQRIMLVFAIKKFGFKAASRKEGKKIRVWAIAGNVPDEKKP